MARIDVFTGSRADRSTQKTILNRLARDHNCRLVYGLHDLDGPQDAQHRAPAIMAVLAGKLLGETKPDLAVLHGDRWETAAAALAYAIAGVPIAHIGGGDLTAGSYDDGFRDAITGLASLHFPTTSLGYARLIELARWPDDVTEIDEPSVYWLMHDAVIPSADEIKEKIGVTGRMSFCLLNWQPETKSPTPNAGLQLILEALSIVNPPMFVVVIGPNNDAGSRQGDEIARRWCAMHETRFFLASAIRETYAGLMKHCAFMIGNSSSFVIEAPHLGTDVILVGNRQRGRDMRGASRVDTIAEIKEAIRKISWERKPRAELIGDPPQEIVAEKIAEFLARSPR